MGRDGHLVLVRKPVRRGRRIGSRVVAREAIGVGSPDVIWRPLHDVSLEVVVTAAWWPERMRELGAEGLRLLPRPNPSR